MDTSSNGAVAREEILVAFLGKSAPGVRADIEVDEIPGGGVRGRSSPSRRRKDRLDGVQAGKRRSGRGGRVSLDFSSSDVSMRHCGNRMVQEGRSTPRSK